MGQSLLHVALVVRDYDEAIDFYVNKLGFTLVEDTHQPAQDKRWVVVSPRPGPASKALRSCWRGQPMPSRNGSSVISPEDACSCF
jgi:catechol 2,3-dioxygenase-like lactoylglutathione lyase family enzyme